MSTIDTIPQLYHYAKPNEFLEVLQNQSLQLIHTNYQSDKEEYYHALDLIKEVIESEYEGLSTNLFRLSRDGIYSAYTLSLSSEKDLLSKWRGYCPDGGFSYSIHREQLRNVLAKNRLMLKKCIYERDEKIEFIKNSIIGVSPETYAKKDDPIIDPKNHLDPRGFMAMRYTFIVNRNILQYAPIMRPEALKEEQEWKIMIENIYSGIFAGPSDIRPNPHNLKAQFKVINNTIIPCLEVPLVNENFDKVNLDEVIIGPTRDGMLAKSACKLLLADDQGVVINNSSIPYENC